MTDDNNKEEKRTKRSKEHTKKQASLDQFLSNKGGGENYDFVRQHHSPSAELQIPIKSLSFILHPVSGDGNCFWYSVSHTAFNNAFSPYELRLKVVKWCEDHENYFHKICRQNDASPITTLRAISQNFNWTSYLVVTIAAAALQLSILIVSRDISYTFFPQLLLQRLHIPFKPTHEVQILFHQNADPLSMDHRNFNQFAPVHTYPTKLSNVSIWSLLENNTISYDSSCLEEVNESPPRKKPNTTTIATSPPAQPTAHAIPPS